MSASITLISTGQGSPSLDDLAARICNAHNRVIASFSEARDRAIDAGQALIMAKDSKRIPHGQWGKFLKRCGVGERQAERYMQLARFVAANPTCKSDLAGLTIEAAIKKVSPPTRSSIGSRTRRDTEHAAMSEKSDVIISSTVSHIDIIDVWLKASPAARERAVDSIGLVAWLDAVPQEWLPQLVQLLTERRQSCIAIVPPEPTQASDDLSVPEFLQGECQENDAQADNDAAKLPNESEEEDHDELEPKPKRKPKIIEHQYSIAEAVEVALGDLSGLASECREATDAAPDNLQQTERNQILAASADALEDVAYDGPTVPAPLGNIPVTCALPKRRNSSRAARASDADSMLEACVDVLNEIAEEAGDYAAAQDLITDLQRVIEAVESCEFPGWYG